MASEWFMKPRWIKRWLRDYSDLRGGMTRFLKVVNKKGRNYKNVRNYQI
jgi:hypothetical protein